jgi:hypothetical protein
VRSPAGVALYHARTESAHAEPTRFTEKHLRAATTGTAAVHIRPLRRRAPSLRSVINFRGGVFASFVAEHAVKHVFDQVQHVRPPEREALHLVGDPPCGLLCGGRGYRARERVRTRCLE